LNVGVDEHGAFNNGFESPCGGYGEEYHHHHNYEGGGGGVQMNGGNQCGGTEGLWDSFVDNQESLPPLVCIPTRRGLSAGAPEFVPRMLGA